MAGKATLTTDPSMNARLEAKIVVASNRRGWSTSVAFPVVEDAA